MKEFKIQVPALTRSLIAFTLALSLLGCGRTINRAAERKIRDVLPELLGPARQYRAHISNPADRTLRGRIASVTIDGDDVQFPNGILLDKLHLDLTGVTVDTDRQTVSEVKEARFTITVSEASLAHFLAGEMPEGETIRNTRIALLDNDQVTISAERVVLGVGVPFRLTGPLRVAGPKRVEFDPSRLVVIGIPIFGKPLGFLKNRFERSVDLNMLTFPVTLTEVHTQRGQILFSGTADVMAIIKSAQGHRP